MFLKDVIRDTKGWNVFEECLQGTPFQLDNEIDFYIHRTGYEYKEKIFHAF